ncbi:MAG: carbon-nitrogen hydrolase family protein [Mycobacteriaceae bacterium]
MRIALAQIESSIDPATNLATIDRYATDAARQGAELIIFPEASMCRFGVPLHPIAQNLHGPWAQGVRSIAQQSGITIITGMFTPSINKKVFNTLFATNGVTSAKYNKIHLFDAFNFQESDTVDPGHEAVTITQNNIIIGLTTCYDIRFPALYTQLATAGAALIVVAASWGDGPGKREQWELLARARALDSTSFIAACGQSKPTTMTGTAPTGIGHSLVVAPTGDILAQADENPALLIVDIDLSTVPPVRKNIPVLTHLHNNLRNHSERF